jgi:hypothetical protein
MEFAASSAFSPAIRRRFDEGEGSFLQKWRKQLDGADDGVLQLAAELLYVPQFFTSVTGPEKKLENVEAVLGWCGHPPSIPEWARLGLKHGISRDQSFNQHRPFHLAWLRELASARDGPFQKTEALWNAMSNVKSRLEQFPAVRSRPDLLVNISVGQGNWATVPWIALLNTKITQSTQEGIYVVFLIASELDQIFLTLNQGQPIWSAS